MHVEVFRRLEPPWFRSDRQWTWTGSQFRQVSERPKAYGGHDVDFFVRLQKEKLAWDEASGVRVEHLRIHGLGKASTNIGCHDIRPI